MHGRPGLALRVLALGLASTPHARAQLDLGTFSRALAPALGTPIPSALSAPGGVIVHVPEGAAVPSGFVRIAPSLGVLNVTGERLRELAASRPELGLEWAPARRLLMNRADGWTRAALFRAQSGLRGRGVVVGIVDTGIDPTHPDLRDSAGRSRILWWLDFSRSPAGLQPELEAELGCMGDDEGGGSCAVLSGSDVEELLANSSSSDDPQDSIGHGTHVASLAAGSGFSDDPPRFVGVAPEASLVVVRAARAGGGIYDADVLRAARFVFERAEAAGMPAVVNLSLGSDFGGHDGSSGLERGLESLVGPGHPGRAIVVAAGNSAGLYEGLTGAPGPFGVHTEVHVAHGARAIVPMVTLPTRADRVQGIVYAWIATRPGDALSVGISDTEGALIEPLEPGRAAVRERDAVKVGVVNDVQGGPVEVPAGSQGAVVIIEGEWSSARTFGLVLEGAGTARIWLQGDGGLSPDLGVGPLVPRARKEGTINVPASAPGLIAVGATLNRTDWIDSDGETVAFLEHGALDDAPPDTSAVFSSAGPNALGSLKPDLVAPGANVIGAMARNADPRGQGTGIFASGGRCEERGYASSCFVVDAEHAVTGGTSMAAPLVAGAVALLFERDPTLDQVHVRALLQAGARELTGVVFDERQVGPGALDLERTLAVLEADGAERLPSENSRLTLGASFAHPDSAWPLEALVQLRDADGAIADGFDPARLTLAVRGAEVARALARLAPGLWGFSLAAPARSGGRTLSIALRFDGRTLASEDLPIAVDPALARDLPSARGGCAVAGRSVSPGWLLLLAWVLVSARACRVFRRTLPLQSHQVHCP